VKFFHTADWHLGKLVQGVHMTEDQAYVLDQFVRAIEEEKPDAVIIAGDLYDRSVPPIEAVDLFNEVLGHIVQRLKTPVLAITGNHDSSVRLSFASDIMKEKGLHIVGQYDPNREPVILDDEHGEVYVHLIPYTDPSIIRTVFNDETIQTHDDATKRIIEHITETYDENARHIYVGHAFVTPQGEERENTSDSERPLAIGGVEYVRASHFTPFHYVALGHLHAAHYVGEEHIRYSGSILKYSISEEHHNKGFYVVELDGNGTAAVEKREFTPRRDMYTVQAKIDDILQMDKRDDYVFVELEDEERVLFPMEKIRTIFPNAMHVTNKQFVARQMNDKRATNKQRANVSDQELFTQFYEEVTGRPPNDTTEKAFMTMLEQLYRTEREER